MALPGVNISRVDGGLNRLPIPEDNISAMIIPVPIPYAGGIVNAMYTFLTIDEAEAQDITEANDLASGVLAHRHIAEFFRINPNGTLHVKFVLQGTSMETMLDVNGSHALQLLQYAGGKVRQMGVVLNPAPIYVATIVNGLDQDVTAAVTNANVLTNTVEPMGMPLIVLIEGRGFSGVPGTVKDARTLNARNVGIVLLQDYAKRISFASFNGYADVGTALGCFSLAAVHENIGWVAKFNLSGKTQHLEAGFSSNMKESQFSQAGLSTLLDKGYLFARTFPGKSGVYFADDPAAVVTTSDYAQLRYGRASQKAYRGVRNALLPYVNAPLYVTPDGTLENGTIKMFELAAGTPVAAMQSAGEISAFDVSIDPAQNVLSTNTLNVKIAIIPVGSASFINVTLSLALQLA